MSDAFDQDETPTSPSPFDVLDDLVLAPAEPAPAPRISRHTPPTALMQVDWILPMDGVPVLRVPRAELGWANLTPLGVLVAMRVDGALSTREVLSSVGASYAALVFELRDLVRRGIVRYGRPS